MIENIKINVVLGLPCTGKTTLSRKLAQALQTEHISIGDLIRDYFLNNEVVKKEHFSAFEGKQVFDEQLIIHLLNRALIEKTYDSVVIDAGPPFDKVVERMNLSINAVFFIHVSDQKRIENFSEREQQGERYDDEIKLYNSRTALYKRELNKLYQYFDQKIGIYDLDGDGSKEVVLSQALSYMLLNNLENSEIYPNNVSAHIDLGDTEIGGIVNALIKTSKDFHKPTYYRTDNVINTQKGKTFSKNNMLLLFKPCLSYPQSVYRYVQRKLQQHGYGIEGIVFWDKESVLKSGVFKAHFDLHYINAKWGDLVIPTENFEGKTIVSAYQYSKDISLIDKVWNDEKKKPANIKHSLWALDSEDEIIINGHIPSIIRDFEEESDYVIAFHICSKCENSMDWRFMREKFLGSTDPFVADSKSLRWEAASGNLQIIGDINFRNNAFHLSSGPFEGYREIRVWFGDNYVQDLFEESYVRGVIDRPIEETHKLQSSLYQMTQNIDSDSSMLESILESLKEKYN